MKSSLSVLGFHGSGLKIITWLRIKTLSNLFSSVEKTQHIPPHNYLLWYSGLNLYPCTFAKWIMGDYLSSLHVFYKSGENV